MTTALPSLSAAPDVPTSLRIALAQLSRGETMDESLEKVEAAIAECGEKEVDIVCFPETFLPGLRGGWNDSFLPPPDQAAMERALDRIRSACGRHGVAAIVGMEWVSDLGLENRAVVISSGGEVRGHQTKNQITPGGEERHYVPDGNRRMFSIKGVPFGIVICHEGWRYPETVRWAARRGARIVFQPQVTGNNRPGDRPEVPWGESFYEMAMVMRSRENSIFFASVNEALNMQNSSTSLIDPNGRLLGHVPRRTERLLVVDIDPSAATGFYAERYRPDLYREDAAGAASVTATEADASVD